MYVIQHCSICRPSDSTVSEDAGIEPRTGATLALIAADALTTRLQVSSPTGQISSPNSAIDLIPKLGYRSHPQTRLQISSPNSARSLPKLGQNSFPNSARTHSQTRLDLIPKLGKISSPNSARSHPQTRLDLIPNSAGSHPQTRLDLIPKLGQISSPNSARSHPQKRLDLIPKLGQISSPNSARSHPIDKQILSFFKTLCDFHAQLPLYILCQLKKS